MSLNKKQLDKDSLESKRKINKPESIITPYGTTSPSNVKKMGGSIKKSGRGC